MVPAAQVSHQKDQAPDAEGEEDQGRTAASSATAEMRVSQKSNGGQTIAAGRKVGLFPGKIEPGRWIVSVAASCLGKPLRSDSEHRFKSRTSWFRAVLQLFS